MAKNRGPEGQKELAFKATMYGNISMSEAFLRATLKDDPSAVTWRYPDYHNRTLLMLAAWIGRKTLVDLFCEAKADPNTVDDNNTTAAMLAAARGHDDCLLSLHAAGADLNKKADGFDAQDYAELHGRRKTVALLKSMKPE